MWVELGCLGQQPSPVGLGGAPSGPPQCLSPIPSLWELLISRV